MHIYILFLAISCVSSEHIIYYIAANFAFAVIYIVLYALILLPAFKSKIEVQVAF